MINVHWYSNDPCMWPLLSAISVGKSGCHGNDVGVLDKATRSSALLIKEALHMCLRPTEEKITRDLGLSTECILASFPGEEWRSFRVTSAATATEELHNTYFARLTIFAMELCHKDIQP